MFSGRYQWNHRFGWTLQQFYYQRSFLFYNKATTDSLSVLGRSGGKYKYEWTRRKSVLPVLHEVRMINKMVLCACACACICVCVCMYMRVCVEVGVVWRGWDVRGWRSWRSIQNFFSCEIRFSKESTYVLPCKHSAYSCPFE